MQVLVVTRILSLLIIGGSVTLLPPIAIGLIYGDGAVRQLVVRALRRLRESLGGTESLHLPDGPLQWEGESPGAQED